MLQPRTPGSMVPICKAAELAVQEGNAQLLTFPERLGRVNKSALRTEERIEYEATEKALKTIDRISRKAYVKAAKNPNAHSDCISADLITLLNFGKLACMQRTDPHQHEPAFDVIIQFAEEYREAIMRQAVTLECRMEPRKKPQDIVASLLPQVPHLRREGFNPLLTFGFGRC